MKFNNIFLLALLAGLVVFNACGPREQEQEVNEEERVKQLEEELQREAEEAMKEAEEEVDYKDEMIDRYYQKVEDARLMVEELEDRFAEKEDEVAGMYSANLDWMNDILNTIEGELGTLHYSTEDEVRQLEDAFKERLEEVIQQIEEIEAALEG